MGQLAERIAQLAPRYGLDASVLQRELHALAAMEQHDPKAALERFHALKRGLAVTRRAELFAALRAFPFVEGVPTADATGYDLKELEADIRDAQRALRHARDVGEALAQEREAVARLRERRAPAPAAAPPASWRALARLAASVEARRRVALREARVEARIHDARRRARKLARLQVDVPDLSADAVPDPAEADAALVRVEEALAQAEALEEALARATQPLKAPEVAQYRGESRRRLEREAARRFEARDAAALAALAQEAEALRREAAELSSQAARARRSGRAPPPRERRAGDAMDGYG